MRFIALLALFLLISITLSQPVQLKIGKSILKPIWKAYEYMMSQINDFQEQKFDKYSLYLAVKNYRDELYKLVDSIVIEQKDLDVTDIKTVTYINSIRRIIYSKENGYGIREDGKLYLENWVIDVNQVRLIQDNPEKVITQIDIE